VTVKMHEILLRVIGRKINVNGTRIIFNL